MVDEFDNTIKTTSLKDKIDLYRKIGYPNFKNLQDYSIEFSNGYCIKYVEKDLVLMNQKNL